MSVQNYNQINGILEKITVWMSGIESVSLSQIDMLRELNLDELEQALSQKTEFISNIMSCGNYIKSALNDVDLPETGHVLINKLNDIKQKLQTIVENEILCFQYAMYLKDKTMNDMLNCGGGKKFMQSCGVKDSGSSGQIWEI